MPFFCLRRAGPHNDEAPGVELPGGCAVAPEQNWQRLSGVPSVEIWVRWPCAVWQGEIDGRACCLLFDGFIARPRRCDGVAASPDIAWLASLLAREGLDALNDVEGQYALCFVNDGTGELLAARDRLGGETLYWHQSDGAVAVASRCRDLVRLPWCPAIENPEFVAEIMALRGNHAPGTTPFLHVHEVIPGGRVVLSAENVSLDRPPLVFEPPDSVRSTDDWVDAFRAAFFGAVDDSVDESGDVAVMLSGGLDSVPVLFAACRTLKERDRRVTAVSWGLPSYPDCDETDWIRMASDAAGVELRLFDGADAVPFSDLTSTVASAELPYFNSMRGNLLACYREAADSGSAIVLAASRGDMIYARRFALLDDLIRRRDWARLWAELGRLYARGGLRGIYRDPATRYPLARLKQRARPPDGASRAPWLTEQAVESMAYRPDPFPETSLYPNPEHAHQLLGPAMTFGTAQEKDFSRRYGIDRRDPFHSETLVKLMLHVPVVFSHMKGQSKWIMREAMRGTIPEPIRTKPRTGVLTPFTRAGFQRNRVQIRELLFDQDADVWERYVAPGYIQDTLSRSDPSEAGMMVVRACIGYTLWRNFWDGVT